ncbi:MAG: biopolymer transport protein ExbB [Paracoccaceae bacterium]|jgi:biopolymer transport protein ExbB
MKRFLIPFLLGVNAFAQTAQEKAEQDLRLAQEQLQSLEAEITSEERVIIREVEKVDDMVIQQHKSLTKLLRDEDNVAGKQRELDNELARRKGEFEFTLSSLRSYGSSIKNRIHPAEKQGFGVKLEERRKKADSSGDDLVLEIQNRLALLHMASERLVKVSGGERFEGDAVVEGNVIKEGKFATAGPLGYFAANDGEVFGFTSFSAEGVAYPTIASLKEGGETIADLVETGSAIVPVDASMGKAIQVARTKKTVTEYLQGGGFVGYGILGLGLVALLIALWKVVEINRFPIPNRKKLNLILDDLLSHESEAAGVKAKEFRGLGGQLVEAGVTYFYDKRRILEDALLEKLGMIQPRLERFLPFLALVAAAAPMMGLLGTVLGIMKTFAQMSTGGAGDSKSFSAGISEALITTAMGLIVAIPVIIVHGMLKSLAKSKFGQAEGVALSMLNGTTELGEAPSPDDEPEDLDETDLVPVS